MNGGRGFFVARATSPCTGRHGLVARATGILLLLITSCAIHADQLKFKQSFLPYLVRAVPEILKTEDPDTGHFGEGIWIVTDQNVVFTLAAAWSYKSDDNPYYHDSKVLNAIIAGGDAMIAAQDQNGMWEFRKKDNSTWGQIYMPWTYSRWIRAYGMIRDSMPAEKRAAWEAAINKGVEGMIRTELVKDKIENIPTHDSMAVYHFGQLMHREDYKSAATKYLDKVFAAQSPDGFWSENFGPVVNYNMVYVDAIGVYYAMSHDPKAKEALRRAAIYHSNFTYPDGSEVETVDERNPYHKSIVMPNVGVTFSPEGRGFIEHELKLLKGRPIGAEMAASYLLYGEEGEAIPPPSEQPHYQHMIGNANNGALVHRDGAWFVCISSYHPPPKFNLLNVRMMLKGDPFTLMPYTDVPGMRWIQDRQNFVSLFHDKTGLILGGGNTKMQPLWSTFTVGDVNQLKHTPGDQNPNFFPKPGLIHMATDANLDAEKLQLDLTYLDTKCHVRVDTSSPNQATLTYWVDEIPRLGVAAHVPLLVDSKRIEADIAKAKLGDHLSHRGWRISVPPGASLQWPVAPHNPYTKDGHIDSLDEARCVMTLPFYERVKKYQITVEVP
jgi:hypothetical protein